MRRKIVLNLTPSEEATLWQGLDVWKSVLSQYEPDFRNHQMGNINSIKSQISI